ncbi:unnamed protein product [Brachionus calyciflorus]|uniref:Uncharacterized protein n=1 Tax=Brachionus calyciflorus TaxID=104777 RepID=A0A814LV98_9BILA|nr:unnamed protein product [Brachionus calyciflorus]
MDFLDGESKEGQGGLYLRPNSSNSNVYTIVQLDPIDEITLDLDSNEDPKTKKRKKETNDLLVLNKRLKNETIPESMAKNFRRKYLCLDSTEPIPRSSRHLFTARNHNLVNSSLESTQTGLVGSNDQSYALNLETRIDFVDLEFSQLDILVNQDQESRHNNIDPTSLMEISDAESNQSQKRKISLALFKLYIKNNMTKTCINDAIKMMRILNLDVKIPFTIDKIIEYLSKESDSSIGFIPYDFCYVCNDSFESSINSTSRCTQCENEMAKFFHINILDQLKNILKSESNIFNFSSLNNSDIYNKIKNQQKGKFYSFTLNTDGISPFKSSKVSVLPIYLVINEIDIKYRYHFSNIILAGLYVGLKKTLFF